MNIMLRRQGLGLDSLRNIISKMETTGSIFRVDLGSRLPRHDYAFNWGNVDLPNSFNNLINKPSAIREVSNKGVFRKKLFDAGLTMPTMLMDDYSPTHNPFGANNFMALLRPANHYGGYDVMQVLDEHELMNNQTRYGRGAYVSKYIRKTKEYRVFIVQGRVVYVVEKIVEDPDVIMWNVHQGGRFINIGFDNWNLRVVKSAVEAFCLTALDFGAVDVIVDNDGKTYVLEINSAPAMTSDYWTSCVAKAFDYMVSDNDKRIPLIAERGGYKKFIHPAISSDAIIPNAVTIAPVVVPVIPVIRTWGEHCTYHISDDVVSIPVIRTKDVVFSLRPQIKFRTTVSGTDAQFRADLISRTIDTLRETERKRLMDYLRVGGFVE